MDKRLEGPKIQLENINEQVAAAQEELVKPFPQEQELIGKETRLVLLNTDLNIDGGNSIDVLNDDDARDDDSGKEQSETKKPAPRENQFGQRTSYGYGTEEPRTGTYGKSAPTFMDNIRSLGERKRENLPPSGKSTEREI